MKFSVLKSFARHGVRLPVLHVFLAGTLVFLPGMAGVSHAQAAGAAAQPAAKAAAPAEIPAGAQSVVSATLGKADEAYRAKRSGQGYATENPANHLAAQYAADGVKIRFQNANLDLEFQGWGYGKTGVKEATAAVAPFADANRVEYRRGALTEWYVNGPLGIEQGFTISQAPGTVASPDSQHDALAIALRLGGTLSASVEPGRHALTLRDQSGVETLRYGPLLAYDASGRELESWMEVQGGTLRLQVNTDGARYPILVDPFVKAVELTSPAGATGDFSRSVAVSGNTVVVGAPQATVDGKANQGAAYVFVEPAGGWATASTYTAELYNNLGSPGDELGWSVGIGGNAVVVSAPYATVDGKANQGAAYVFVEPTVGGVPTWTTPTGSPTYNAELTEATGNAGDSFGWSVGINENGNVVVVGDPFANTSEGAAYVFVEPTPGGWALGPQTENAKLTDSTGLADKIGWSVGINESGTTVVAGAPFTFATTNANQGAAYVYVAPNVNDPTTWATPTTRPAYNAQLTASDGLAGDFLGNSVSISGNTVVVGAPQATIPPTEEGNQFQGAAYVFVEPTTGVWATTSTFNAKLTASDGAASDFLGWSVGISGNTVVAGAYGSSTDQGAAYVFVEPTTGVWVTPTTTPSFNAKLIASDGAAGDEFGFTVGISGSTVVVGAQNDTVELGEYQGAAYVFTQSSGSPIQISPTTLLYGFEGESYFENLTATGGSGTGYTWSVISGTGLSAVGLSLTSAGVISGYPNATETAGSFTVQVTDSQGNIGTQDYTLTIYPDILTTPTTLPTGIVGTPYSQMLSSSGGAGAPFSYSVASGTALSAVGLTLSPAGLISGTPSATETAAPLVIQVADMLGNFTHVNYTLTINAVAAPLTISPTTLPAGTTGTPYSQTLTATGGSGTGYSWAITSGATSLANFDVILSPTPPTAVIVGIPSAAGMVSFTVQVTDSLGDTATQNYTLTINNPAPIASLSPTSLAFAAQVSGTTSAAQTVTLTNTGNAPLSITGTGISISGANATDFAQTNQCGTGVAAYGGSCAINVTFTPSLSEAGSETATLNVADNAGGTPQQVQLSGIALPPPSVSCNISPVTPTGDMATEQITCTATGLTGSETLGPIALDCNLPASLSPYITCSFSPSSLNFTSAIVPSCSTAPYTACTTLTIQPSQSGSLERKSGPWAVSSGGVAFGAVFWLPAWVFVTRRKKGKSKRGVLLLLILFCGLPMITSCGGKSKGPATPPAGAYQGSMVLTGPGLNETITFTIQVP
jgi:hypothetical protein